MNVIVEESLAKMAARLACTRATEARRSMFREKLSFLLKELRNINSQREQIYANSFWRRLFRRSPHMYDLNGPDESILKIISIPIEVHINQSCKSQEGWFFDDDDVDEFVSENIAWIQLGLDKYVLNRCLKIYELFPVTDMERNARRVASDRRFEAQSVTMDIDTWNWINFYSKEVDTQDKETVQ